MAAYKYFDTEFEDGHGWHCMNASDLGAGSNEWHRLPRLLGMPLEEYVDMLIKKYKPDNIRYNADRNVLSFSWKSLTAMRKFKNDMNKKVRTVI